MKDVFLVNYKVKGIKTLDEIVSLSFYKKTINMPIDTQEYNMKGIYGMNGSGKSGIIASVDILRNLITDKDYLNNPIVQKNLDAIINKKTKELYIEAEFLIKITKPFLFNYKIVLKKNPAGRFVIDSERLSYKHANSRKIEFKSLVEVCQGEICHINIDPGDVLKDDFMRRTANLLSNATVSALFINEVLISPDVPNYNENFAFAGFVALFLLGKNIHVYMDEADDHVYYFLSNMLQRSMESGNHDLGADSLWDFALKSRENHSSIFDVNSNLVRKDEYNYYEESVGKLKRFIKIFKPDLNDIYIDRKEDEEHYICTLNMVYETYSVNSEFESTGIKKLIKLFAYLREMAQGGIAFIDELDSNLHDVYLCALLEYLMDYGAGQLCFTTHNVGPMDILKKHKKSIDFLSMNHKIYPWTTNGNYSPSKLYRNGMIEGSPFNIEAIDFIGVFDDFDGENC